MFKIVFKTFKDIEGNQQFELLEEASMYFFRNLGATTQRIELYENTSPPNVEPFYRLILSAHRMRDTEAFIVNRMVNIF